MLLDLSEIVVRDGMRAEHEIDQPCVEDPDLEFAAPVQGRLTFANSGEVINITGPLQTTLLIPCSRCLVEVKVPVQIEVDEHLPVEDILHPNREPAEGAELETIVSSIIYLDQGRPILDLDELIRQLLIAEVPIRTLCDENCAGLCPQCGANRNENPCRCAEQEANRPLAALGALLKDGVSDGVME